MAYREIGMWEILEVLRRVARGERQRAIERVSGHSRSTIRRWVQQARELGWEPGNGEPDEALALAVAQRLRPVRDEASPGESQARLLPHREQIQAWLEPGDARPGRSGPIVLPLESPGNEGLYKRMKRLGSSEPIGDGAR
jgi:transposase-like protein